ncbi:MAG: hypothetical protein HY842_04030, partial [Bacteroidetes bacterium]|nr:hypothetical protein [Bacteroidota bacterium]
MKSWFLLPVSLLAWLAFSGLVCAQPNCVLQNCCCGGLVNVGIPNGNFEDPQTGVDIVTYFAGQTFGGWSVLAGSVDLKGPNYGGNWTAGNPNGPSQFLDLNGFTNGTVATNLTGLTMVYSYTIVIRYAKNTGTPSADCHITVAGGAWLDDTWTATNNGADGWLETCFTFIAQGSSAELQLAGSSSVPVAGMLLDDMTMWGCPNDTEPPVVANPPPTPLFLECSDPLPPPPVLTVTDDCAANLTSDFLETTTPKPCFYTLQRTWTFTDDCGNMATVEQSIDIDDTQPPVFGLPPADITVGCGSGYLDDFNDWLANNGGGQATDNCSSAVIWQANYALPPDGSCGETTVVFFAIDGCGNTAIAQATFTIADVDPPILQQPAQDLTVPCSTDPTAALNNWLANQGGAIAEDPCGAAWANDYPGGPPPPFVTVIFQATDGCGNSVATVGVFLVENIADTTLLDEVTCDSAAAGIFTQNLTGQNGCDSVVITTVTLLVS